MQIFRKGFRQTIGYRLDHDRIVIITLSFISIGQGSLTNATSYCKRANPITFTALFRSNIVRQTVVGPFRFLSLLTQVVQHMRDLRTRFITVHLNVIAHAGCWKQCTHTTGFQ
ncbi:Uncharacterised protein [Vibrio cholerae]|nr:Uncharacterised protein [Vibrio cholerae]CSB24016.1 Uncharacterised protein [Vibrio cholerae]CSC63084.1 Uncharacterised protein [Vibrio cholerae]